MDTSVLLDYELSLQQTGYIVRALLKFQGRLPDGAGRLPLNLALVLDRSGSMGGGKLERAREAAVFLVRRLGDGDCISVVTYDETVATVAERAGAGERDGVARAIERIPVGGTTNLSGGWLRGHELVGDERKSRKGSEAIHRVLLLTDGLANVGITDPSALVGLCGSAAASGVGTTTIGFGADYDEDLLRRMADAGGGNTYYIERPDQAPGVFEEEIEGLLSLAAQNVAVSISPSSAVELVAVHNDLPLYRTADGARVDVGDVYAREPRSLLLEFFVPGLDGSSPVEVATLTVAGYVLTGGGGVERQEIVLPIRTPLGAEGRREPEVRREMLLLAAARAREDALRRRDAGDIGAASQVLRQASVMLHASPEKTAAIEEQAADLASLSRRLEERTFDQADAKYVAQRAYNVHRKRELYEQKLSRRESDRPRRP